MIGDEPLAVRIVRRLVIGLAFAASPIYGAFYFAGWLADERVRRRRRKSQ